MNGKRRVLAIRSAVLMAVALLLTRALAMAQDQDQDVQGHDTYLNQPGEGPGEWLGILVIIAVVAFFVVWLRRRRRVR